MALKTDKNVKLYYSIKEVTLGLRKGNSFSQYLSVDSLTPTSSATSNKVRQYTEKDIEQVKVIYSLIKVKGLKIAAARKYLSQNRTGAEKSSDVLETLISVRDELKELKKHLDALV